ncbi:MAG: 2-C-methyl-D-erythritol 4-phosphate cytidylyltransferase, partial [Desulfobacterales bacterium]
MQDSKRKQYKELEGKPILAHTLMAFDRCDSIDRIIVALPVKDLESCRHTILSAASANKKIE